MKNFEKKYRRLGKATLGDLGEIIGEFLFFDDEKVFFVGLDQPKAVEALHKQADPWSGRAHHLGQILRGKSLVHADAARVLLAHGAGQLQQRLAQPLLAIRCHHI